MTFQDSTGRVFTPEMAAAMDAEGAAQVNKQARCAGLLKPLVDELHATNKHLGAIAGWMGCFGWMMVVSLIGGVVLALAGLAGLL